MTTTPSISVLMPVYNCAPYLHLAIQSILDQTFEDFEFIIVNDGSTDGSGEIIRGYASRDPRIRTIHRPNAGIVTALNNGLDIARGQWVARMDGDDVSQPERFERQMAYLRQHPRTVLLGTGALMIEPFGTPLSKVKHLLTHEQIDADLLGGNGGALTHPSVMMSRQAAEKVGRYRKQFEYAEDLDLFLRLAEVGQIANLPDDLLLYRQHLKSVNQTRFATQTRLVGQVVADAFARRGLPPPGKMSVTFAPPMPQFFQLRAWAWNALAAKRVKAARRHAIASLRKNPFSTETWRLMLCVIRGH